MDNEKNTELLENESTEKKSLFKKISFKGETAKKLKYGSLSVVATAIGIAVIIVINILVGVVAELFPSTIDTTGNQVYEISQESIDYLKTVEDYDIDFTFIGNRQNLINDTYYQKIVGVAEKYKEYKKNFTVNYVDLDKNPGFAANYDNANLTDGDAIVSYGDRFRHLTSGDFLISEEDENSQDQYSDTTTQKQYSLNAEYAITTSIMVVTASDNPSATVITGHGERTDAGATGEQDISKLILLLENNGFTVSTKPLNKALEDDVNLLIIAAPTKDYSEDELKQLDTFLYNNGKRGRNIMYIADYDQPVLKNLEAFLSDWGFEIMPGVVYESDDTIAYANMPYLNTLTFVDESITLPSALREVTAYGYWGRPAKIKSVLDVNMENKIILEHTMTSKLGKIDAFGNFIRDNASESFPYTAMACTKTETILEDYSIASSSVLFVNSLEFFNKSIFEKSQSANSDVTIAAVNSMLGRENNLYIPAKKLTAGSLGITLSQANLIGGAFAIGVPVILLVICLVVYIRRRFL